ncbi:cyclin-D1-1-like isoform X1 [Salvia hispanica]|uniref:cyclin-D1-1-like isoform X1 n=1 Tax=Salvia hispanica TaxID=49212 RepID=UPI0020093695|nr:cyclin-D1-1-like isoform X1 [Salvia hispanica]
MCQSLPPPPPIPLPRRRSSAEMSPAGSLRSDQSALIARLLDSEPRHMPHPDYIRFCHNRPIHLASRQDSINSILKVHSHFEFKPVTAFLSINYLDRFLAANSISETGWQFQLLSIACLSLAAKMEELHVPCLVELQSLERTYIFEPKTVQRMELLILTTLDWRLRSVTPFDYLDNFISMLPSSSASAANHSVASDIILNTSRVVDFMRFPPSVIAAAAAISSGGAGADLPDTFDERINREMVRSCHQLMEEYLLDTCLSSDGLKAAPPSPHGVLDAAACASCDTNSENQAGSEPQNKRPRLSPPDVQES